MPFFISSFSQRRHIDELDFCFNLIISIILFPTRSKVFVFTNDNIRYFLQFFPHSTILIPFPTHSQLICNVRAVFICVYLRHEGERKVRAQDEEFSANISDALEKLSADSLNEKEIEIPVGDDNELDSDIEEEEEEGVKETSQIGACNPATVLCNYWF